MASENNIVFEFHNFVEVNSFENEKKQESCEEDLNDLTNMNRTVLYWIGKCKPNKRLKMMLVLLQRMRLELGLDSGNQGPEPLAQLAQPPVGATLEPLAHALRELAQPYIQVTNENNKIVLAQVMSLEIYTDFNCFEDTNCYPLIEVSDTGVTFNNNEGFKVAPPEEGHDTKNIKHVFLTYLASIVNFVDKKTELYEKIGKTKFKELGKDNRNVKKLKGTLNEYLDLLSEETVGFPLLLNWLFVSMLFGLLDWGVVVLAEGKSDDFSNINSAMDMIDLNNPVNTLLALYANETFRDHLFSTSAESGSNSCDTDVESCGLEWEFRYFFTYLNKKNIKKSHEWKESMYVEKCADPGCNTMVTIGLPYCKTHLEQNAHLCIEAQLGEEGLYKYEDGVTACDSSKAPEEVVFAEGQRIIKVVGEVLERNVVNKRYDLRFGLHNKVKYLPYTFQHTDKKTQKQVWVDGSWMRGVAFMIRQSSAEHPANVIVVIVSKVNVDGEVSADSTEMWIKTTRPILNGEELFIAFANRTADLKEAAEKMGYEISTALVNTEQDISSLIDDYGEPVIAKPPQGQLQTLAVGWIRGPEGVEGKQAAELATQTGENLEYIQKIKSELKAPVAQPFEEMNMDRFIEKLNLLRNWFENNPNYKTSPLYEETKKKTEKALLKIEERRKETRDPNYLKTAYTKLKKYIEENKNE